MKKLLPYFEVANFRVFDKPTKFNFAPLTILTGKNNSGKSSLIKAIVLVATNYSEDRIKMLEFDNRLNLASFRLVKNKKDAPVIFSIPVYSGFYEDRLHIELEYTEEIINNLETERGKLSRIKVSIFEKVLFEVKKTGEKRSMYHYNLLEFINSILPLYKKGIKFRGISDDKLKAVFEKTERLLLIRKNGVEVDNEFYTEILESYNAQYITYDDFFFRHFLSSEMNFHTSFEVINSLAIQKLQSEYKVEISFTDFFNSIIGVYSSSIATALTFQLKDIFPNINHVPSNRAINTRFYLDSENSFINKQIEKINNLNISNNKELFDFLNYWVNKFEISSKIIIKRTIEGVGSEIKLDINGILRPLVDFGWGSNQVISVLFQIIISENDKSNSEMPSLILVEEPESNLHPNLQSKLADLFIDAIQKFGIQFIIETHSEYFIRKLQVLTAKKVINPDDTMIYYFHDDQYYQLNKEKIRQINIKEDGYLTRNFGPGFFDETDNHAMELYRMQKSE